MLIYYIIFFFITAFAISNDKFTSKTRNQFFGTIGVFLFFFAGLRGLHVDNDYSTYKKFFTEAPSIGYLFTNSKYFFSQIRGNIEPSISLIMSIIKEVSPNGFQLVIIFYAFTSIILKLIAIRKMSDFASYSLLIYFSSIYLLQDMTQIRIAVATGFLMLSIPHILKREFKAFILLLIFAVLFHYSALVFLPFYFFNTKSINKLYYLLLILLSIILALIQFNPFEVILKLNLGLISEIIKSQFAAQTLMKKMNIFNTITLFNLLLCLIFIFNIEKLKSNYSIILIKIYSFSIIVFFIFSFSPVIAFRTSEVLNIAQIILLPQLIYIIKPKMLAEGTVILISFLYFINQIFVNQIMNPYVLF